MSLSDVDRYSGYEVDEIIVDNPQRQLPVVSKLFTDVHPTRVVDEQGISRERYDQTTQYRLRLYQLPDDRDTNAATVDGALWSGRAKLRVALDVLHADRLFGRLAYRQTAYWPGAWNLTIWANRHADPQNSVPYGMGGTGGSSRQANFIADISGAEPTTIDPRLSNAYSTGAWIDMQYLSYPLREVEFVIPPSPGFLNGYILRLISPDYAANRDGPKTPGTPTSATRAPGTTAAAGSGTSPTGTNVTTVQIPAADFVNTGGYTTGGAEAGPWRAQVTYPATASASGLALVSAPGASIEAYPYDGVTYPDTLTDEQRATARAEGVIPVSSSTATVVQLTLASKPTAPVRVAYTDPDSAALPQAVAQAHTATTSLRWRAPEHDGGMPIKGYTLWSLDESAMTLKVQHLDAKTTTLTTDLQVGAVRWLTAENAIGSSEPALIDTVPPGGVWHPAAP